MKLFVLPNLTAHKITISDDVTLATAVNPRPAGMSKEDYNNWCRDAATSGFFISPWEGLTAAGRVTGSNPVVKLHGIVADYDNTNAIACVGSLGKSTSHLPTWVVESFTPGKARLIWPFENPVQMTNPSIAKAFLEELDKRINIGTALPGFDKATWKETQYFELGTNWQQINGSVPIPSSLLSECMLNGGLKAKLDAPDVELPLNVVAEEVEKRWPGRWGGAFVEGAVGPLFWIEPFVNHRSCAIRPDGMVCYSDRAPSSFVPWRNILGDKFVEAFETERVSRLAEMFWFDGSNYWGRADDESEWVPYNQTNAQLHLKGARCSPKVPKGKYTTEIEDVLIHIHRNRHIAAAVPMLFQKEEIVQYNGFRYLNTSTKEAMAPAETGNPEEFPWIYDFIQNAFDGEQHGVPAKEFFIGWLRRFWLSSYEGNPLPGQSVILAGGAGSGKTFFSKCVIGPMVGGSVTAEDILLQRTKFNRNAAQNALWRCDDAISEGDQRTKQTLANSLKQMAANPTVVYQPKYVDATELPFRGRVFLTCNTDPESLKILPYLDGTIKDKLMLFRMSAEYQPHFSLKHSDNEARVMAELPHFLRWLMNYSVHPDVIDPSSARFEIRSFHHSTLVSEANSEQPESLLAELLNSAMVNLRGAHKKGETVKMTATELARAMEDAQLGRSLQQLGGIRTVGKLLHKVAEQKLTPALLGRPTLSNGTTRYKLDPWADFDE